MTMAGNVHRAPCPPTACTHAPEPRPCTGCGRRVCGEDSGWKTTTGRVFVCDPCLDRHRRAWMAVVK